MQISQRLARRIWGIHPAYLLLILTCAFFSRNLLPTKGNFICGIDIAKYSFWQAQFVKEQFLAGNVPLWNPYYYCGHPFLANPQTFIFYPATLLFVFLPLPWAFHIDFIGHIFLAAMGMYCLAFLITGSKSGGLAAGIIYGLSGYFMDNIYAGHITMVHSAALIPWIFYFVEKAYKDKRTFLFAISGLFLGLQILSGEPQNSFYTVLSLALYILIRHFSTPHRLRSIPVHKVSIYFFLILAVGFGISAVQILPSAEFMSLSDRAEKSYEFSTSYSFLPRNLFTFLVPQPETLRLNSNWEFAGYSGILSIILAATGAAFSKDRRHVWCFCGLLFFALTVMLGRYSFFYPFYYRFVPGISVFRIPARAIIIAVFSAAVLAGFGVQYISLSQLRRKHRIFVAACFAIVLLCILGGAKALRVALTSKEILLAVCFTIVGLAAFNLPRFLKKLHLVPVVLVAVLFIDLYLTYSNQIPIQDQHQLLQPTRYQPIFTRDPGFYRVASPTGAMRGMKFKQFNINGYTPICSGQYFYFVHNMACLPKPVTQKYTIRPELFQESRVFSSKILGIKYAIVFKTKSEMRLLQAPDVMPRAVLVREAVVLPDLEEHLHYMKKSDFDPIRQVVLQTAPDNNTGFVTKADSLTTQDDTVKITRYQPNRIELESVSDESCYLVLSELFYPGWRAYVDKKRVPILRANYLLRAVPLPAGNHNVAFVYKPASFLAGAAISVATVLLLGCIYCIYRIKRANVTEAR